MKSEHTAAITGKLATFLQNPLFVREHGTWAIVIIPLLTGFLRSLNRSTAIIPLFLAYLFLFFAYHPFEILLQFSRTRSAAAKVENAWFWFLVWFITGTAFGLYAVISSARFILFLFALAAIFLLTLGLLLQRKNKISRIREFLGILALSLGAPAVLYFLDGEISARSLILWIFNVLFFMSSSFFVHLKMMEKTAAKDEQHAKAYKSLYRQNYIYQTALLVILLVAKTLTLISYPVVLAFLPMIIHCLYAAFPANTPVNFKKVGFTFLAYSLFFGIMFAL